MAPMEHEGWSIKLRVAAATAAALVGSTAYVPATFAAEQQPQQQATQNTNNQGKQANQPQNQNQGQGAQGTQTPFPSSEQTAQGKLPAANTQQANQPQGGNNQAQNQNQQNNNQAGAHGKNTATPTPTPSPTATPTKQANGQDGKKNTPSPTPTPTETNNKPTDKANPTPTPTPSDNKGTGEDNKGNKQDQKPSEDSSDKVFETTVGQKLAIGYPGFKTGDAIVFTIRDAQGKEVHSQGVQVKADGEFSYDVPVDQLAAGEYTVSAISNGYHIKDQKLRIKPAEKSDDKVVAPQDPNPPQPPVVTNPPVQKPADPVTPTNPPVTENPKGTDTGDNRGHEHGNGNQDSAKDNGGADKQLPKGTIGNSDADVKQRSEKKEADKPQEQKEQVDPHVEVVRPQKNKDADKNQAANSQSSKEAAAIAKEKETAAAARQAPAVEPGEGRAVAAQPVSRSNPNAADAEKVSSTTIAAAPVSRSSGAKDQDAARDTPGSGTVSRNASPSEKKEDTGAPAQTHNNAQASENTAGDNNPWGVIGGLIAAGVVLGGGTVYFTRKKSGGEQ
ncbi:hypothetical protein [Rothia dentocariosa]|uniref:hypothetical protein n=1 Tax=Rothia dentocariosa TaxID=2047 RepID=UPI003A85929F